MNGIGNQIADPNKLKNKWTIATSKPSKLEAPREARKLVTVVPILELDFFIKKSNFGHCKIDQKKLFEKKTHTITTT